MTITLDDVFHEVLEIKTSIAVFTERFKKVDELDETINGNGKDGLKLEFDRVKKDVDGAKRIWNIVVAAVIGVLVAQVLAGLVIFFRILPLLQQIDQMEMFKK